MKKLILILLFLTATNSAWAWGDFERGIATGIGGAWLYNRLTQPPVVVQQPQPYALPAPNPTVYVNPNYQPRPYWCRTVPVQDTLGRTVAFQQVCD